MKLFSSTSKILLNPKEGKLKEKKLSNDYIKIQNHPECLNL